jgi:TP901 family phage tail tape measure protein
MANTPVLGFAVDVDVSSANRALEILARLQSMAGGVAASQGAAFSRMGTQAAQATAKAVAGSEKVSQAALTSAKARENAEKQWSTVSERVSKQTTDELIADTKRLQDEKVRIMNAIGATSEKEAKAELRREKELVDSELRILKQHALERKEVLTQGAGAKAGLMGTGRQVIGGLKDSAMASASGMAAGIPGGSAIAALGPAGMAAAAGIGVAVVAIKSAIDVGSKFEDTMADLQAITGLSAEAVGKIGDNAKVSAVKFGISASEVVGASKLLISALGPDIAKDAASLDVLTNNTLTLAKATGEEADVAARAITVTMGQFGLNTLSAAEQAKQSTRIINVLGAAAQKGNAEVGDLSEAMKVSGTVANQSGVSIEQTAAALEVLAASEIKGAEGGTGFRNVLLKMSSGSEEANKALESMGMTFADINPKKVGLEQGLINLKAGFDKLTDPVQKAAAAKRIFGLENAAAANVMLQNIPMLKQMTKDVTGTATAHEQAAIKQATFSEAMNRGKAALENIGITIYEKIKPALAGMADAFTTMLDVLGPVVSVLLDGLVFAFNVLMTPHKAGLGGNKGHKRVFFHVGGPLGRVLSQN